MIAVPIMMNMFPGIISYEYIHHVKKVKHQSVSFPPSTSSQQQRRSRVIRKRAKHWFNKSFPTEYMNISKEKDKVKQEMTETQ